MARTYFVATLVKYGTYHKDKSSAWKKDISKVDNWSYNEEEDSWTCAAGQKLTFHYESKTTTELKTAFNLKVSLQERDEAAKMLGSKLLNAKAV